MSQPALLTKPQAIEFLASQGITDLKERWLDKQMDAGNVPYVVIANKRRVRQDVLERMIKEWFNQAR